MLNHVKKGLIAAGVIVVASVNAVAAPLTAADIPMSDTIANVGVVFLAILGVTVLAFGFRKVMSFFGGK